MSDKHGGLSELSKIESTNNSYLDSDCAVSMLSSSNGRQKRTQYPLMSSFVSSLTILTLTSILSFLLFESYSLGVFFIFPTLVHWYIHFLIFHGNRRSESYYWTFFQLSTFIFLTEVQYFEVGKISGQVYVLVVMLACFYCLTGLALYFAKRFRKHRLENNLFSNVQWDSEQKYMMSKKLILTHLLFAVLAVIVVTSHIKTLYYSLLEFSLYAILCIGPIVILHITHKRIVALQRDRFTSIWIFCLELLLLYLLFSSYLNYRFRITTLKSSSTGLVFAFYYGLILIPYYAASLMAFLSVTFSTWYSRKEA